MIWDLPQLGLSSFLSATGYGSSVALGTEYWVYAGPLTVGHSNRNSASGPKFRVPWHHKAYPLFH